VFRFISITSLGLLTIAVMNAGQIQIGSTSGTTNNGLTAGYIAGGCAAANGPSFAGCLTGTTGSYAYRDYAGTLFTNNTPAPSQPAVPSGTGNPCNTNTLATAGCLKNSQVAFALINDGTTNGYPSNYWDALSSSSLIIPVGIFGTDSAWTMINNQWGVAGNTSASVTFYFGSSSNTTDAGSLTFNLVNGQLVRDATQCAGNGTGTIHCSSFATTLSAPSNVPAGTSASAGTIYSEQYSAGSSVSNPYKTTTGTEALDYQHFTFGTAFLNDYLSEVKVTDIGGAPNNSRTGVSAVTVDVAPEPSTILMFMTGLGAIGFARFRKTRKQ